MFMVSAVTARKWAARFRAEGPAGMRDRSSRPHSCPTRTSDAVPRKIVRLRWRQRLGPVQIGGRLNMPASTVHTVLVRCRINRLSRIDRVSGEPLRRYEHPYPGSLIHVDVTKFGNVPDGGGHRYVGRQQGKQNNQQGKQNKRTTPPACPAAPTTTREPGPPICTPSSMTTPAWPMSKAAPTKRPRPLSRS